MIETQFTLSFRYSHLSNYMFVGNRHCPHFIRRQIINLQEFYSVYSLLH